ncbi:MAG: TonB-dependent receptor [Rhodothermales bacterium]
MAVLFPVTGAAWAQTGTLQGYAEDAETETALADVNVAVRGSGEVYGASTDVRGRYTVAGLEPGRYRVEVSALGYLPQAFNRSVAPGDTLRLDVRLDPQAYELNEITVGGVQDRRATVATVQSVPLASLAREDATAAADVARLIPAAHVQTNSRGETLVYLRGAGERQVAVFFDGALLNIPWDNRVDLSLVPASVIGGMTVAKGGASVLYGTNVSGGAINLTSRALEGGGAFTEVSGTLGQPRAGQGHLTRLGQHGRLSYTGSIGYAEQNGAALPGNADLPFSQQGDIRTNTDRQLLNGFVRGSYWFRSGARLGVSALHIGGEKGIAPESHLDPDVSRVRYWRYPAWRTTMLIGHGALPVGPASELRGAVWGSFFTQRIRQFGSARYDALKETQDDEDLTAGTRLTWRQPAGPGTLHLALNALTSQHEQQNVETGESGQPAEALRLTFRQHVYSGGAEYELPLAPRLRGLVGGSLDAIVMPLTGDKPGRDPFTDWSATTGLVYDLASAWTLRASTGRKVRFPTMRELFGEALNRFLVNPDLQPETSVLAEVGAGYRRGFLSGEVIGFYSRTSDAIDQRTVEAEGGSKRQRINLEGSRAFGVEAVGGARLGRWSADGHLTWLHARTFREAAWRPFVERPEWLGTLTLAWNSLSGFSLAVQPVYTGRAYSLDDDGALVPLPASLALSLRTAYGFALDQRRGLFGEVFFRIDNATDAVVLPQLGLPGPGREARVGASLSF